MENKKFDYYTVQVMVDGFGNDTYVAFSSRDYAACENYIRGAEWLKGREYTIVGQRFNQKFNNEFE